MLKKIILLAFLLFQHSLFSQSKQLHLISWNIQDFGKTKNSGELEKIADIIKGADIVAIQEVVAGYGGAQAVAKLTAILNRKGSKWDYVISNPTNSPKYVAERYAFVWKTKHIKIKNRGRLIKELEKEIDREPFLLDFYINGKKLSVLNFHSRPFNKNPQSEITALTNYCIKTFKSPLILAGDFNVNEKDVVFNSLKNSGYAPAVLGKKTTLKKACNKNNYLNHAIDNIFYSKNIIKTESSVIDFVSFCENLTNARKLSDHLPVYLNFSVLF
ncbi:endonuclease/exonuclease/phosphatase family protein [uncultured Maribacter sp.]|uniref:endonuclease/exonuclease/phosphatase family protein n=1 Tax=uncultured Maribacter sp. TaxID=431308 RepID=UPI0026288A48|nr:endonuclease/exonuclease/phosphatase family protein [uncultured Maribacter sp.]